MDNQLRYRVITLLFDVVHDQKQAFFTTLLFFVFLPLTRTKMIDDPVIIMSLSINSRRFGCSISKQKLQHAHSLTRSDLKLNVICWSLFLPRFFFWLIGRLNLGDHPNSGLTRKSESILINCGFRGGFLRVLIGPSDGKYIVLAAVDKDGLLNTPLVFVQARSSQHSYQK